jgi:hypothetical protein
VFARLDRLNRSDNEAAMQALQQQGIKFVSPDAEELARWKALSAIAIEKMVQEGVISGEIVDQVNTHLINFRNKQ